LDGTDDFEQELKNEIISKRALRFYQHSSPHKILIKLIYTFTAHAKHQHEGC